MKIYNVYYRLPGKKRFKLWAWYIDNEKAEATMEKLQSYGWDVKVKGEKVNAER